LQNSRKRAPALSGASYTKIPWWLTLCPRLNGLACVSVKGLPFLDKLLGVVGDAFVEDGELGSLFGVVADFEVDSVDWWDR
jgi:hypothetical protein